MSTSASFQLVFREFNISLYRSNSIYRSAAALAALLRLCSCPAFRRFFRLVSDAEPIFQLEKMKDLHESPKKMLFLSLVKLGRTEINPSPRNRHHYGNTYAYQKYLIEMTESFQCAFTSSYL